MLIRLVITNFLSFGEETEFNLLPTTSLRLKRDHLLSVRKDVDVLKASVIYGANGAGKSNLIKAVDCIKKMVESGRVSPFASTQKNKTSQKYLSMPTTIEAEFSVGNEMYSYGITYDPGMVQEEWLYQTSSKGSMVFERKFDATKNHSVIRMEPSYIKSEKNKLLVTLLEENLLKSDELLLSYSDKLNSQKIHEAYSWFRNNVIVMFPDTKPTSVFDDRYSDAVFMNYAEALLSAMNVGITALSVRNEDIENFKQSISDSVLLSRIENAKKELDMYRDKKSIMVDSSSDFTVSIMKEDGKYFVKKIVTRHSCGDIDVEFELKEESDGTQRVFDFIPLTNDIHSKDVTCFIDEIDRSLHPSLVHAIVRHIMNDRQSHGQIVFSTHESSLLSQDVFRNDEIWFAEKNPETQCTQIYTLSEFKPRTDLNLEKGYLYGRFGAIPFISGIESIRRN